MVVLIFDGSFFFITLTLFEWLICLNHMLGLQYPSQLLPTLSIITYLLSFLESRDIDLARTR